KWHSQSYPFSASVYRDTTAQIAQANCRSTIQLKFVQQALKIYALTKHKDDVPFAAEAHYPTIDMWLGDSTTHSEHCPRSTYFDNILTKLLRVIPTLDDGFGLRHLIAGNWTHFAVKNLPYHGSLTSILWD
ncbi:hypothetical protein LTR16_006168, partial [Cryomyces antarcticus]